MYGILSIVLCCLFGIPAWIMGNEDIRAMDSGEMDARNRALTQAGRILGIIGTCLLALYAGLFVIVAIVEASA